MAGRPPTRTHIPSLEVISQRAVDTNVSGIISLFVLLILAILTVFSDKLGLDEDTAKTARKAFLIGETILASMASIIVCIIAFSQSGALSAKRQEYEDAVRRVDFDQVRKHDDTEYDVDALVRGNNEHFALPWIMAGFALVAFVCAAVGTGYHYHDQPVGALGVIANPVGLAIVAALAQMHQSMVGNERDYINTIVDKLGALPRRAEPARPPMLG